MIKEVLKETTDCVSIVLHVPVELKDEFAFIQGQSITIRSFDQGEDVRRSYSICSSPLENELRIAVKHVPGGYFSTLANTQLKAGDSLEVMSPSGNFYTDLDASNAKNYVAFAAGSGITPVLSIIKTTLASETNSSFTIIYGNRNSGSVIFKEALEALKNKYMDRFTLIHVLSREKTDSEVNYGRISAQKCNQLAKLFDVCAFDEYFLCGPESMIFNLREHLELSGVASHKIHFELFTTPVRTNGLIKDTVKMIPTETASLITVKVDGRSFDFNLDFDSNNILDAALAEGADLPYACKGGVCCTCKAKLLEGEVEMEVNYGLEPDEVEQGFILTCQAHPRSSKVVVDYDVK